MKKTSKSILILVNLCLLLILCFINSNYIIKNIIDYSMIFLTKLFPVSFLFYIISSLIISYGIIDIITFITSTNSSKLYLLIISMISGFPSGAKNAKELYDNKYLSLEEANEGLIFTHFPNPLFIVGTVGSILGSKLAIKILISIFSSNIILFFIYRKTTNNIKNSINNKYFSLELSKAINNSFQIMIIVYGTSLFFYIISSIITKYIFLNSYLYVFICGIFDLTKGIITSTLINNIIIRSYMVLLFISFGGLAIHMQVKGILGEDLSYYYFLKGRIIGTIISFIIFSFLFIK